MDRSISHKPSNQYYRPLGIDVKSVYLGPGLHQHQFRVVGSLQPLTNPHGDLVGTLAGDAVTVGNLGQIAVIEQAVVDVDLELCFETTANGLQSVLQVQVGHVAVLGHQRGQGQFIAVVVAGLQGRFIEDTNHQVVEDGRLLRREAHLGDNLLERHRPVELVLGCFVGHDHLAGTSRPVRQRLALVSGKGQLTVDDPLAVGGELLVRLGVVVDGVGQSHDAFIVEVAEFHLGAGPLMPPYGIGNLGDDAGVAAEQLVLDVTDGLDARQVTLGHQEAEDVDGLPWGLVHLGEEGDAKVTPTVLGTLDELGFLVMPGQNVVASRHDSLGLGFLLGGQLDEGQLYDVINHGLVLQKP